MELSIEAVYEDGVLKPTTPLPFKEHEKVRVVLEPVVSPLLAAYGMLQWTGDPKTLEQLATDPEYDPQENL